MLITLKCAMIVVSYASTVYFLKPIAQGSVVTVFKVRWTQL